MGLAQAAERLGDAPVLERLRAGDPALALVALRIAPHLRAPEEALPPLIALAAGRDPDLSEGAARSVRQIVQAAASGSGSGAEGARDALRAARSALQALAEDETLRPDIRLQVLESLTLLVALVQ
jgi:hypothetical protein